ncbi:hypothetical protein [Curtobacterium sp. MCBD17_030]|uniref:hypothetical protein n=1 Tax=Curtobacterium sp. MCBD17_030 TaxID=2175649 RepID=UPI0011B3EF19|nr:hypothetical protein [Curtobacterium sp. MCBD17_030]
MTEQAAASGADPRWQPWVPFADRGPLDDPTTDFRAPTGRMPDLDLWLAASTAPPVRPDRSRRTRAILLSLAVASMAPLALVLVRSLVARR